MKFLLGLLLGVSVVAVPSPAAAHEYRCEQWHATALAVGWPAAELETLDFVIGRESSCLPDAYNGRPPDNSYGLTQINTLGNLWTGYGGVLDLCGDLLSRRSDLFDPATNLSCALRLHDRYGWAPWGVTAYAGHQDVHSLLGSEADRRLPCSEQPPGASPATLSLVRQGTEGRLAFRPS